MFSFAGDTVLDPFVGTGTTMLAAARAGRNSIGIEVDPTYVQLARERLGEQLTSMNANRTLEVLKW
jgi:DNA modification methylase